MESYETTKPNEPNQEREAGGPMGALPWEHFYDNGQLAEKDSYRNGIRIGMWEERQ